MASYDLTVNGRTLTVESADPDQPLLYVIRNQLGLTGTRFGCGLGQCGACTVMVEGEAARSCQTALASVAGRRITTIEGLGTLEHPHAVEAAFIVEQAAQCGYCARGMVMSSAALLQQTPAPTLEQAKEALAGNPCPCGPHHRILRAVMRASGRPLP